MFTYLSLEFSPQSTNSMSSSLHLKGLHQETGQFGWLLLIYNKMDWPTKISASNLSFGAAPPRFQPSLATWRDSLSSLPPTFPFTVCKPWPSARGMVLVALTAEYQECLKAGPFDVHYQCISAWWHCDCSTRMRCVDTFCWHLSLIYLYREDAWNVPVS